MRVYLLGQHLYALGYLWLEFDPGKELNVKLLSGGTLQMTMGQLSSYAPVVLAWAKALAALRVGQRSLARSSSRSSRCSSGSPRCSATTPNSLVISAVRCLPTLPTCGGRSPLTTAPNIGPSCADALAQAGGLLDGMP